MTHLDFLSIFKPVVKRHPETFTADVCEKVYKMFSNLNLDQGREVITQLLFQSRMTPTEDDFKEVIHMIVSKANVIPFRLGPPPKATLGPQETNEFFGFIRKITSKEMSGEDVKQAEKLAWQVVHARIKCRICLDEGYVHASLRHSNSSPYIFKCQCPSGSRVIENFPTWRTEMTRDYRIILNGPDAS